MKIQKMIFVIILISQSAWANPLTRFKDGSDKAMFAQLAKAINETEKTKIEPEWITKYYQADFKCDGKKIIVYNGSDVKIIAPGDEKKVLKCGKAGCKMLFLAYSKKDYSDLKILFSEHLIDFSDPIEKKNCPEIPILMHGKSFGRKGGDSGVAHLQYNKGKYELVKSGKKIKEFEQ
jgi:hypothetical protein